MPLSPLAVEPVLVQRLLRRGWGAIGPRRGAFGVDPKTVRRWVWRFQAQGLHALQDRSSRPRCQPTRTRRATQRQITALRRQRWGMDRIASFTGVSPATVGRVLQRAGLNRLQAL